YADAFELRLEGPDRCSPEEWVRAGVAATPAWIKQIAGAKNGLGSVRIVESNAEVVVLEDSDTLMDTVIIGRNVEPERRVLTTVLRYRRSLLARAVWAFVGVLHRRTARRVVAGGSGREIETSPLSVGRIAGPGMAAESANSRGFSSPVPRGRRTGASSEHENAVAGATGPSAEAVARPPPWRGCGRPGWTWHRLRRWRKEADTGADGTQEREPRRQTWEPRRQT
ncbi:MAG: hypothetical protein ACRDSJ_25315, partial [Rubrobacteraceae bacterium]